VEEIEQWLVQHLASYCQLDPDDIDVTRPFDEFAIDSATAVGMTGDLESWLGRRVDPTLLYDYPTIEKLSKCLESQP
jgi:acyl carrier protein